MSDATQVVQAELVAALSGNGALAAAVSGVFDGPPARVAFPYLVISDGATSDWGFKGGSGREHRLEVTVWDDGQSPNRLQGLVAEVEAAIEGLPVDLDGHRLVSIVHLRSRLIRSADGPWSGRVAYRARTIAG